jgi:hypothetical protein
MAMLQERRTRMVFPLIMFCALTLLLPSTVTAYSQYSQIGADTNCASCHGDFRSNVYISPVDGQLWGNIHNLHRNTMLSGDCDACHSAGGRFPVLTDESLGGDGLAPIGCMGCHGRSEDNVAGNPSFPHGLGAGLRQHHTNAGVDACTDCHDDASPANYTPVGEQVLPSYYANPGTGHDNMPTGSCNDDGSEHFAGATLGLDNDGNSVYDTADPGCDISAVPVSSPMARLLQNHPNPFNPTTDIQYVMGEPGHALLQVFSVTGERVRTLVNANHDRAATYQVTWNGEGEDGRSLPSGIYFYRLESPNGVEMKKMVLLK